MRHIQLINNTSSTWWLLAALHGACLAVLRAKCEAKRGKALGFIYISYMCTGNPPLKRPRHRWRGLFTFQDDTDLSEGNIYI